MVAFRIEGSGFDPLAVRLDRFRQNVEDAEPALRDIGMYQKNVVNKRTFTNKGPSSGGRWAPLSDAYAKRKQIERPGRPLLVYDGDLRRGMTSHVEGIFEVTSRSVTTGISDEIAGYHHRGTPKMPARPLIGRTSAHDTRAMARMLHQHVIEGVI